MTNNTNNDIQDSLENIKKYNKLLLQDFCTIHSTLSTQHEKLKEQPMTQENVDAWARLKRAMDICNNRIAELGWLCKLTT